MKLQNRPWNLLLTRYCLLQRYMLSSTTIMERTLAILKPGIIERKIVGELLGRIERSGLDIIALKMARLSATQCQQHYAEHEGKPFYNDLVEYMSSAPVLLCVIEGVSAIAHLRRLCGATDPQQSAPGSIRGDYALEIQNNVIHASDSAQSAAREIALFFESAEIVS